MSHGIPDGIYELDIGDSFLSSSKLGAKEFNTLRFDFKPASVSSGNDAYIATSSEREETLVIVPGENRKHTIFRGSKKPIKGDKECLIVFDHESKELRLEKLNANINVKKTRDVELDVHVKGKVEQMQKKKRPPTPPLKEVEKERTLSSSSISVNGDHDSGDVDVEVSALEQMMSLEVKSDLINDSIRSPMKEKSPKAQSPSRQPIQQQKLTSPKKKLSSSPTKAQKGMQKSILHEDLQLSESSEYEED